MTSNQVLSALHDQEIISGAPYGYPVKVRARGFAVVGHRGAMALAPENSAASFRLATAMGADEIELDVRVTRDGVPVVLHDPTLERLAAEPHGYGRTNVDQLTLAQVHEVLLNSANPALTFADVLELTDEVLQVEIKDPSAVHALAGQIPGTRRIKFSSFLPEALFLLALHFPAVPRGLIVTTFPATERQKEELEDILVRTGASTLYTGFRNLEPAHVESLHAVGIEVHVWPLRCPEDLNRALALNADGGTADDPGQAKAWLVAAQGTRRLLILAKNPADEQTAECRTPQVCPSTYRGEAQISQARPTFSQ